MLMRDVAVALNGSLHLSDMLGQARRLLTQLVPADYTGLCIVSRGRPSTYEWVEEAGAPNALLARYAELQPDDFVLKSVVRQRDTVLRDSEMLPRKELERSPLYLRSCELGLKLEQVLATLMTVQHGMYCGFTMYRDRRRPFSRKAQAALQLLSPSFAAAIYKSHHMDSLLTGERLLDAMSRRQGFQFLVVAPPAFETRRSERATALVEKWFTKDERTRAGLPKPMLEHIKTLSQVDILMRPREHRLIFPRDDENLVVIFIELPESDGPRQWAMLLHEVPKSIPLPEELAQYLSAREMQIAWGLLRNWSPELIAKEFNITLHTAKTHVRNIYKALNCDNRVDFLYQAARLLRPI
ncbi:LuxR family transcriptional regulator [Myxococcus xanthus]|nr:LuxR family transcriptional regulator [Myxococcus xanthus]QPM83396.1 LuxR family transcriptional regulator [Myxococcus xanthus]QVW71960.1 LuxR family transcriptional regulator [Myxococcus xanthus DZ2]UEO08560.1 LuxR C-terminal-related transcriptional regulator [Myxococcus xanthus DZ2]